MTVEVAIKDLVNSTQEPNLPIPCLEIVFTMASCSDASFSDQSCHRGQFFLDFANIISYSAMSSQMNRKDLILYFRK